MNRVSLYRRCGAEFFGTLAIVFFGCGSIAVVGSNGGWIGSLVVSLVFGMIVTAMIFSFGPISTAHFNPAVTLAFASARRFPLEEVMPYIGAQILGAIAGSGLHRLLLPDLAEAVRYGASFPSVGVGRALGLEIVQTFFLMLIIVAVATNRRANGPVAGIPIGATVTLCGLFGGRLSGCSMNPARSLGPALFAGSGATAILWIYVVGPIAGALLGAWAYELLRDDERYACDAFEVELPEESEWTAQA